MLLHFWRHVEFVDGKLVLVRCLAAMVEKLRATGASQKCLPGKTSDATNFGCGR